MKDSSPLKTQTFHSRKTQSENKMKCKKTYKHIFGKKNHLHTTNIQVPHFEDAQLAYMWSTTYQQKSSKPKHILPV
jgi:hypothetical protein